MKTIYQCKECNSQDCNISDTGVPYCVSCGAYGPCIGFGVAKNSRLDNFLKLKDHAMIGKDFKKLTALEVGECVHFINENEGLDSNKYAEKANRWKLDQPEARSKNYTIMWSLLIQSNNK